MNKGRIVQIIGPVIDVMFNDGEIPNLYNALKINYNDISVTLEVVQHI